MARLRPRNRCLRGFRSPTPPTEPSRAAPAARASVPHPVGPHHPAAPSRSSGKQTTNFARTNPASASTLSFRDLEVPFGKNGTTTYLGVTLQNLNGGTRFFGVNLLNGNSNKLLIGGIGELFYSIGISSRATTTKPSTTLSRLVLRYDAVAGNDTSASTSIPAKPNPPRPTLPLPVSILASSTASS